MKRMNLTNWQKVAFMVVAPVMLALGLVSGGVSAMCARLPLDSVWINPHSGGYVRLVKLVGPCYEPGDYPRGWFQIGEQKYGWDRLDVIEPQFASDYRRYAWGEMTLIYHLRNDGWLEMTTNVNFFDSQRPDQSSTDYLLRLLDERLARYTRPTNCSSNCSQVDVAAPSVAACGVGCITGVDVTAVSFVVWTPERPIAMVAQSNMFCATGGGGGRCNPLPTQWTKIEAEINLRDGSRLTHSWTRGANQPQPITSIWPYGGNVATISPGQAAAAATAYDLLPLASKARWETAQLLTDGHNGRDIAVIPFQGDGPAGSASANLFTLEDGTHKHSLQTHPKWTANGTIKGWFPWAVLPANATFQAEVGFVTGATQSDGVTFWVFEHHMENGREVWNPIAQVYKRYDGRLAPIRANLSHLSGQNVSIELRVDAGPSSGQDWAVWVSPRITGN